MNISTNDSLTRTYGEEKKRLEDARKSHEFLLRVALFLDWITPGKAAIAVGGSVVAFAFLVFYMCH